MRPELSRVDEDADSYRCVLYPGLPDQRQVSGMEVTHGWNESTTGAIPLPAHALLCQLLEATDNSHNGHTFRHIPIRSAAREGVLDSCYLQILCLALYHVPCGAAGTK